LLLGVVGHFDSYDVTLLENLFGPTVFNLPLRVIRKITSIRSGPPLHRIIRRPFHYLLWRFGIAGHEPITVTLKGGESLIMRYGNDWFTAAEVFLHGDYKPPFEMQEVRSIADLGGNVGYATIFLGRLFPNAFIDVFEPHPAHVAALKKNLILNRMQHRVSIHPNAAGAEHRSLYLTDADTCSSLVSHSGNGVIPVQVIDWLDFAKSRSVDLLKMDIEGGEYEILFDPRFEQLRIPVICMEWHIRNGECRPSAAERLRSLGYRVINRQERRLPEMRCVLLWAQLDQESPNQTRASTMACGPEENISWHQR